eukprot:gnl/TRDRNA2_/TRDRNA2_80914_c0_seq1.p1 gnl/TRDRNA2_/TRDRNA2_80914_c0~~gnl/TRDRNA2_/TRDRNA2_80914_c0_seq1.p1  ORF type:complete len:697 (+),score=104.75 gnl/TRDRNA2_/TRDRNA2_80914_c0_seq1:132-2093(+)
MPTQLISSPRAESQSGTQGESSEGCTSLPLSQPDGVASTSGDSVTAILEPLLQRDRGSTPRVANSSGTSACSEPTHRSQARESAGSTAGEKESVTGSDWTAEAARIRLALKEEQESSGSIYNLLDTRIQGALRQLNVYMADLARVRQEKDQDRSEMHLLAVKLDDVTKRVDALELRPASDPGSEWVAELEKVRNTCKEDREKRNADQIQLQSAFEQLAHQLDGITMLQKAIAERVENVETSMASFHSHGGGLASVDKAQLASGRGDGSYEGMADALAAQVANGFFVQLKEELKGLQESTDARFKSAQEKVTHLDGEHAQLRNELNRCTEMLALAAEGLPSIEKLVSRHGKRIDEIAAVIERHENEVKELQGANAGKSAESPRGEVPVPKWAMPTSDVKSVNRFPFGRRSETDGAAAAQMHELSMLTASPVRNHESSVEITEEPQALATEVSNGPLSTGSSATTAANSHIDTLAQRKPGPHRRSASPVNRVGPSLKALPNASVLSITSENVSYASLNATVAAMLPSHLPRRQSSGTPAGPSAQSQTTPQTTPRTTPRCHLSEFSAEPPQRLMSAELPQRLMSAPAPAPSPPRAMPSPSGPSARTLQPVAPVTGQTSSPVMMQRSGLPGHQSLGSYSGLAITVLTQRNPLRTSLG